MYYMGIDVGSTTCKVVIIDTVGKLVCSYIEKVYAEPLDVIKEILKKIDLDIFKIKKVGVTGSARILIAKCINSDIVKSEIIAHTYAAVKQFQNVGSIIEIGGQDSKFVKLENNMIKDFKINSVCAAGTGSFIEWQAKRLNLSVEEFDKLALESNKKLNIAGKCAVFIESAIINYQRIGESKKNITNAICEVLVKNYLNEVCKGEILEEPIIFQGGVAKIKAMQKAFEKTLGKKIFVSDNCQNMGALGMALIAKDTNETGKKDKLNLNNIYFKSYKRDTANCGGCPRNCEVTKFIDEETNSKFIIGGRCGKNSVL
ncbi:acyl-CoA dehydratase activase [Clostridium cibarium]|uniref:Rod shape-determining protein n=1 Tax=Clostridium cibarium TaxID=2762247 RepID=A0ABR8PY64_9CLOT|nr:acyl-CoA dehydratase activase [Clostridium cibarium]MBD7913059.1 rod shape-determining protein [Clostridium cibarium]